MGFFSLKFPKSFLLWFQVPASMPLLWMNCVCAPPVCFVIQKCYVEERLDLFYVIQQKDLGQMNKVEGRQMVAPHKAV